MNATLYQLSYFAYSSMESLERPSPAIDGQTRGRVGCALGSTQVVWLHIWIVRSVVWKAQEDQISHEPLYISLQEHLSLFLLEQERQNAFVNYALLLEDNM